MFPNSHSVPDHKRKHHSPQTYADMRQSPGPSPALSLPNLAGSSSRDASVDLSSRLDGAQVDVQDLHARQVPQITPRSSQNRAPFGKWKSKAISGFPAADAPLSHGVSAKELCESYPNHVNDHTILALMREGNGAKAIDALIPAPPGKQKAVQSHSKIQLRVSTIREAFPNENFPITSMKRKRERSNVPKNEAMSPDDEDMALVTAHVSANSEDAAAESSTTKVPRTQATGGLPKRFEIDTSAKANRLRRVPDIGRFASTECGPSQIGEPSLHFEDAKTSASCTTELELDDLHLVQTQSLKDHIRLEYQKHKQLVFDVFYQNRLLPPLELIETIQAHCAAIYDSDSRRLQARCGSTFSKIILNHGELEHPLSYLRRSIKLCFERLPDFQARVDFDCQQDQTDRRLEIATLQESLSCLHRWTGYFESRIEIERLTRAHKNLHETANRGVTSVSAQHPWIITPSPSLPMYTESSSQPNPILPDYNVAPSFGSWASHPPPPTMTPADRAGKAVAEPITMTASMRMKMEISPPVHGSAKDHQLWGDQATVGRPLVKVPGLLNRLSGDLASRQSVSHQVDQGAGSAEGVSKPSKSSSVSEINDHMMVDGPQSNARALRHEFDEYMEEVGDFVNHEARATYLPLVSGKLLATYFSNPPLKIRSSCLYVFSQI
jgi:hypothetical protein